MIKVLITGTAGFIGFRLADKLLKKGRIIRLGKDKNNIDYYLKNNK